MERGVADISIFKDIIPAIIRESITMIINIRQILTFSESLLANGTNSTGNTYHSKILTAGERITTDLRNAFRNGKLRQTRTFHECARHDRHR